MDTIDFSNIKTEELNNLLTEGGIICIKEELKKRHIDFLGRFTKNCCFFIDNTYFTNFCKVIDIEDTQDKIIIKCERYAITKQHCYKSNEEHLSVSKDYQIDQPILRSKFIDISDYEYIAKQIDEYIKVFNSTRENCLDRITKK